MIELRPSSSLGRTSFNGVEAIHHFCFGPYQSLERVNWGALRMLNRLVLAAKGAREPHFLGGMEVVLIVEQGEVEVRCGDTRSIMRSGDILRFATNAGSDFGFRNHGGEDAVMIEIWLALEKWQGQPEIRRTSLSRERRVVASNRFRDGPTIVLRSSARISIVEANERTERSFTIETEGHAYVWGLLGCIDIESCNLREDDAAAIRGGGTKCVRVEAGARCLVVECWPT